MIKQISIVLTALAVSACSALQSVDSPVLPLSSKPMSMPSAAISPAAQLTRVGFGSCFKEGDDMSIWDEISHENPDLFVFLGDNVYGDNYPDDAEFTDPEMPKMQRSYAKLSDSMTFARFRSKTPMLFTWDDHDYGVNDGGADYPFREKAQELFLDAWNIPANDPRRSRPGIYSSETFGPEGERVQFILLDTRYFRGPLTKTDEYNAKGKERYVPSGNASSTMLGETQWAWLEDELRKPADVRFLISSVQVIADGHGWEAWKMLPHERNRLYKVLRDTGAANTVLISGDRHAGAHYKRDDVTGFPLYEMTTSSLNAPVSKWKKPGDTYVEPGPHRITAMQDEVNYGMADIDWSAREVNLRLVNPGGETWTQTVPF